MFENLFVEVTANGNIANGDVVQYDSAIGASGKIRAKKAVANEINANPKLILGVATNADFKRNSLRLIGSVKSTVSTPQDIQQGKPARERIY